MLKVGDEIETWFSGRMSGKSTVLEIKPYTGLYKQFYTHDVRATALNTHAGSIWISINERDPSYAPAAATA